MRVAHRQTTTTAAFRSMMVQHKCEGWNISCHFYTAALKRRFCCAIETSVWTCARNFQFDRQEAADEHQGFGVATYFHFYDAKCGLTGWLSGTGWFSAGCNRLGSHFSNVVYLERKDRTNRLANATQRDKDKLEFWRCTWLQCRSWTHFTVDQRLHRWNYL